MKFLLIPDDARMIDACVAHGIDRVFIDLEVEGKLERQAGLNAHFSSHGLADVADARKQIPAGAATELLVRINPVSPASADEVDAVVGLGCDLVMLPMFRSVRELSELARLVDGRLRTVGLFETPAALGRLRTMLAAADAPKEAHLGLNDLSLGLGLDFLMESLAGGLVDHFCRECAGAGVPFGFGGVGALGTGAVPAELILSEHVRLGSTAVILSRTFRDAARTDPDLFGEMIRDLRAYIARLREQPCSVLEANRRALVEAVSRIAAEQTAP
ncbi:aldolase/citrate lyase family protein [Brevundimonas sp.]|uniref:aldolase/citrate lyase family protein n=1 Tax=Brevundimonas sp. TaxID=1871086 RepID=UPI002D3E028E|nr:aldolase/citrate lyase family protein [Brevundimonas sp.]HYD28105.1 aldolase/citrate lyase family protein [Brevundimonas sp.]